MGLRTPLFDEHHRTGAKIVDFGGWDMPVVYSSIIEEHNATRSGAGLFDVSHMGRLWFKGAGAKSFLEHVLTNKISDLKEGQVRYSLVLNLDGGTRDDVLVYRFDEDYLMVVNASNRQKLVEWFEGIRPSFDVDMTDATTTSAMMAVQGPLALPLVQSIVDARLDQIDYYFSTITTLLGSRAIVSRTGYTGEDGVELIADPEVIVETWSKILDVGREQGVRPAGLGARDTLRIEAGMPLYGHELLETIDPVQAGLGWAVKSKDKDFIGKDALLQRNSERPVRVGLELDGKRIAREGYSVRSGGDEVGAVTSGTLSPTLQKSIAMAFVDPGSRQLGTQLTVDVRGSAVSATVVRLPFYRRAKH